VRRLPYGKLLAAHIAYYGPIVWGGIIRRTSLMILRALTCLRQAFPFGLGHLSQKP
jgi:hypothetical protein